MVSDQEFMPLVANWFESTKHIPDVNLVLVALDKEAVARAKEFGNSLFCIIELIILSKFLRMEVNFLRLSFQPKWIKIKFLFCKQNYSSYFRVL